MQGQPLLTAERGFDDEILQSTKSSENPPHEGRSRKIMAKIFSKPIPR
jgi:hypothetical protein